MAGAQLHKVLEGVEYRQIRYTPKPQNAPPEASAPPPPVAPQPETPALHVRLTPAQWRLLRIGVAVLAALSIAIGFVLMITAVLNLYSAFTGPVEYRSNFQALGLVSAVTAVLAWSSAIFIAHRLVFKR